MFGKKDVLKYISKLLRKIFLQNSSVLLPTLIYISPLVGYTVHCAMFANNLSHVSRAHISKRRRSFNVKCENEYIDRFSNLH